MKILITGGAGFIGSHLCDKYTKEGYTMLCLDNFMSGNLINVKHLRNYRNFKLIKSTRKSVIAKISVDMNTKDINIDIIPVTCDPKEYYPKNADEKDRDKILSFISATRSKIENKSLSDYRLSVGDYPALADKYKREAKMQMKMQFIKNLHKYPLNLSMSIVKSYLQKLFR